MTRAFLRLATLTLTLAFVCGFTSLHAQSARAVAASTRVTSQVDTSQILLLRGHVPDWANAANDRGAIDASKRIDNMHLILNRAPSVQAAFEQLLADQQDPSSPRYHQWLTPQQNAQQYGVSAADLAAVTAWLQSWGLSVDDVAAGGVFITFSGTAASVQNAFSTQLHSFAHESGVRYAPTTDPSIPAAIGSVVGYVTGLSENMAHVHSHLKPVDPNSLHSSSPTGSGFTPNYSGSGNTSHATAPGDFNTIYDITPVLTAGTNGTGYSVGILIDSDVAAADVTGFKALFAVPAGALNTKLVPGQTDPGISGDEGEADLDFQRVMATAPGATANLVVFATLTDANVQSALQYEISTLNDSSINMSFGSCDYGAQGLTRDNTFNSYFQTASAQGISLFASSGDQSAAACDAGQSSIPATQVLATNINCAGQYVTCVGGTEFADSASPSTYWSATNNTTTQASALGYIPEGAWNDPGTGAPFVASGTGGGVSQLAKPSWQVAIGVPTDGLRDEPDISFTASGHDGYFVCETDIGDTCTGPGSFSFKFVILGTSASSPSMAGVSVLIDQKLGARQGNLNPTLYKIYGTTPSAFHDAAPATSGVTTCAITTPSMCNNSTPTQNSLTGGLSGYPLTLGYDLATGLGSLDVNAFLTAAAAAAAKTSTTLATTVSPNPATVNGTVTLTATITRSATTAGNATGTVTFSANGTQIGPAVTVAGNAATTTTTFSAPGTYPIIAVYSGDTNYATSTATAVGLTVTAAPTFSVTPAATALSLTSGATTGSTDVITFASLNTFAGPVNYTCSATGVTGSSCSLTPTSGTLTSGGNATSTLTITTTAGTSGVLNVTVTGTSGTTVVTSSAIAVTLTASSYTLAASPTTISIAGNATTGNTTSITITPVNNFSGTVTVTCASSVTTIATCTGGSAAVTPSTAGHVTMTVTPIIHASGTSTLTISGTGNTIGATIAATASTTAALTVTTVGSTTTVVAAPTAVVAGSPTVLTATVTGASANGNPTGTVTLFANGTAIIGGTGTLSTTGGITTATYTYTPTTPSATAVSITAVYAGDTGYNTSTSAGANLTVTGTTASAASSSISFTSGATTGNTDVVTFTSVSGFAGTITVNCSIVATSGSPAFPATCAASAPAALTSGGTTSSTVTITSTTAQAHTAPFQAGLTGWGLRGGAVLAMLICLVPFRRRRFIRSLTAFVLLACSLVAISGCGGSAAAVKKSSAGTYTVTTTGTCGTEASTATFTVTIN